MFKHPALQKIAVSLLCLFIVYLIGVAGYMYLEGWDFEDASFMTVITVATVGYGETHALDSAGRWFTVVLIIGGMGVILYGISNLTAFVVEGELHAIIRRTRMDNKIDKVEKHYIVCGAGRTGRHIIDEILASARTVVVIDMEISHLAATLERHPKILTIEGDASSDRTLERAGIHRASGLMAALPNDKENLFVVLTAKCMNPNLRIVAKVEEEEAKDKMKKAGADCVICPQSIGGMRMASEMVRPTVVKFLDAMLREKDAPLRVEEVSILKGSPMEGKTLEESRIAQRTGLLVVAMHRENKGFKFNPPASTRIEPGDLLVVIGEIEQVLELRKIASP